MSEPIANNYWQAVAAIAFGLLLLAQVSKANGQNDQLADPTQPAQFRGSESAENYRLESILNSRQRRVAIINGQVLGVGEMLGDARVATIGRDRVGLQVGSKTISLKLPQQVVKKEVRTR